MLQADVMNSGKHFGQLLRTWRTEGQLTQQQVADMLGIDKSQEVTLETGKRKAVTVEEALQLCDLMGMSITEALTAVTPPPVRQMEDDWLGWRIATDTNTPMAVVRATALRLYGHDASTEHAIRCAYIEDTGSRRFAATRGNYTRSIIRQILNGVAVAS